MLDSAMAEASDDDLRWAPDTYKLSDIIEYIPTLVRVTEGIYSCNDAGTFSQGDIIKIDACKPMTRVSAYLTRPGSNIRYAKCGEEISLPYNYNGRLNVLPLHGEYHKYTSVQQLIEYFPRYVRVLARVNFTEPSGKARELHSQDTLELKAVRRNKSNVVTSLRCSLNNEDIILPRTLSGVYQVLPDDAEQTIRDVVESYKLPQCVRFLGSGIQEIMSKDIQEAIDNLTTFSGTMILTGKMESASVLFGHYKGMEADPSSRFCRRSAVVIPMDIQEISEIEVQMPFYMEPSNYELFLLNNFSQSSSTQQALEGALYAEFAKTSKVQFLSDSVTPAVPPRRKPGESTSQKVTEQPPALGPRPLKVAAVQPFTRSEKTKPPDLPVVSEEKEFMNLSTLAEVFNHEPSSSDEEDHVYAVPDETKLDEEPPQRKAAQDSQKTSEKSVSTIVKTPSLFEQFARRFKKKKDPKVVERETGKGDYVYIRHESERNLQDMTTDNLGALLMKCGMPEFAKVCKTEAVDGVYFQSLTSSVLKSKPFKLSDFHIDKVDKIRNGWRPKS